jgi:hypothetical protein
MSYLYLLSLLCSLCNIRTCRQISGNLKFYLLFLPRNLIPDPQGHGGTDIINCLKGTNGPEIQPAVRATSFRLFKLLTDINEILYGRCVNKGDPNLVFLIFGGL